MTRTQQMIRRFSAAILESVDNLEVKVFGYEKRPQRLLSGRLLHDRSKPDGIENLKSIGNRFKEVIESGFIATKFAQCNQILIRFGFEDRSRLHTLPFHSCDFFGT